MVVIFDNKKNDAEYVLNVAEKVETRNSVSIFSQLEPELVGNMEFLRKFFEIYNNRGAKLNLTKLFEYIPKEVYEYNEEFWDMMEEFGYGNFIKTKYVGDNPERMKQRIKENHLAVKLLSPKLASDEKFIFELIQTCDGLYMLALFKILNISLRSDIEFIRKYLTFFEGKKVLIKNDFFQYLPVSVYEYNEEFWDMMEEIGYGSFIEYRYVGNNPERMKQRVKRTPTLGIELLSPELANNGEFILGCLEIGSDLNPLYTFKRLGENLRKKPEFVKKYFEYFRGRELNIKSILPYIPEEMYMFNDEFWQHLEDCGIVTSKAKYAEYRYTSQEELKKAIEAEKEKNRKESDWRGLINIKTGTMYDEHGYDIYGYNNMRCNRAGFYESGFHRVTGTRYNLNGIDEYGYDKNGYKYSITYGYAIDRHGFTEDGWCVYTNDFEDQKGKTKVEYDYGTKRFIDVLQMGWNRDGTHKVTKTKYDEQGYDIHGYDEQGYDRQGYDMYGYNKIHLFNRNGIHKITKKSTDREGRTLAECKKIQEQLKKEKQVEQYTIMGEKHPNIMLINEFLEDTISRKTFCIRKGISEEDFSKIITEVTLIYPEYEEKIESKLKQTSAVFLSKSRRAIDGLLSGEITLKEYSRERENRYKLNILLSTIQNADERRSFETLVLNQIISGELTMMDYFRLFSEEYDARKIINSMTSFVRSASKEFPDLAGKGKPVNLAQIQLKGLETFTKQYKSSDFVGMKIGQNGQKATITEEHISTARDYLRAIDQYICYITMYDAVKKIALGIISQEDIDREIKAYNLRRKALEVSSLKEKEEESRAMLDSALKLEGEYQVAFEGQAHANVSSIPNSPSGEGR